MRQTPITGAAGTQEESGGAESTWGIPERGSPCIHLSPGPLRQGEALSPGGAWPHQHQPCSATRCLRPAGPPQHSQGERPAALWTVHPGREPGTTQSPSDRGRKAQPGESTEDEDVLGSKQSRVTEDLGLDVKGGAWTCGQCHPHLLMTVAHTPLWRRRDGARPWLDPPVGVGARPPSPPGRPHHTDFSLCSHVYVCVVCPHTGWPTPEGRTRLLKGAHRACVSPAFSAPQSWPGLEWSPSYLCPHEL